MAFADKKPNAGQKPKTAGEKNPADEGLKQSGRNMMLYFDFQKEVPRTDRNMKAIGDVVGSGAYHYCDVAIFTTVLSDPKKGGQNIAAIEVYLFDYYVPAGGKRGENDGVALAGKEICRLLKEDAGIDSKLNPRKSTEFEGDYIDILPLAFGEG